MIPFNRSRDLSARDLSLDKAKRHHYLLCDFLQKVDSHQFNVRVKKIWNLVKYYNLVLRLQQARNFCYTPIEEWVFEFKMPQFSIQPSFRMTLILNGKYSNTIQLCSCRRISVSESFQFSFIARVFKGLIYSDSIHTFNLLMELQLQVWHVIINKYEVIACKTNISWTT